jgi:hypothetical protein
VWFEELFVVVFKVLCVIGCRRASADGLRPLGAAVVQELLERCWTPPGVALPDSGLTSEVLARLVRVTDGNLRLLKQLLTQVECVLGVNDTQIISVEIVDGAGDSLIIGQA